jgi:endonuclease/exonuclease/phosphatase family metal-dependent hydrolase
MKRAIVIWIFCLSVIASKAQIRAVSYNIRYNNPSDRANAWTQRLPAIKQQLNQFQFDILGIQEGLHQQIIDLQSALGSQYSWIGVGRDSGDLRGEFCAIFYNQEKFTLISNSYTQWLSPTPNKPSKGWDAALPRIVTFAKFKEKSSGKSFWVFNTHFDHMGKNARFESALLLSNLIHQHTPTDPAILLGDFNCQDSSAPIQFLSNKMEKANPIQTPNQPIIKGTFNGFAKDTEQPGPTIDHIFINKFNVKSCWVDYTTRGPGLYISDHYPILVDLQFR